MNRDKAPQTVPHKTVVPECRIKINFKENLYKPRTQFPKVTAKIPPIQSPKLELN